MKTVSTTDLYESTFYLCEGCSIETIEGVPVNGNISCKLVLSGPNIEALQVLYFKGEAKVDLFTFRRAYAQVNSYVHNAKKKLRKELTQQKISGEEASA